ncbi:hypothetical protein PpBr36_05024 [Pyricularia pennisetigena]|uniref:hypothetical protein n=1 Tax=Pyricularia pennisetigena TaxID=1578925 RepID=UPI00114F84B1|nr:hypothetical protein PpBr36_05024 [Pyricularia pennisetigena]TLS27673.1 hypothetical protein PpBr36_05024 [Pyricularia pennisetigena]
MHFSTIFIPLTLAALKVSAGPAKYCVYYAGCLPATRILLGHVEIGTTATFIAGGYEYEVQAKDQRCEVILTNGRPAPAWLVAEPQ